MPSFWYQYQQSFDDSAEKLGRFTFVQSYKKVKLFRTVVIKLLDEIELVQVADVAFVNEPVVLFLRLDEALNVDHLCEIPMSLTRQK